jgi:hypothetical protein
MAYINGSDLMVFLNGKSIANAQSHTFTITNAIEEISTKDVGDGGWTGAAAGKNSFTMSTDNLVGVETDDKGNKMADLIDLMIAKTEVDVIFALKADGAIGTDGWTPTTSGWYQGKAIIDNVTVTAQDGQRATYTANFTGTGALTKTTA